MSFNSSLAKILKVFLSVCSIVLLTACGSGSSQDDVISSNVSGSVGDGPVTGATVRIYNSSGQQVITKTSDETASYSVSFKLKGKNYPLILKVSDGIDLVTGEVPDFEMVSIIMSPASKVANINPFSTLIVKMAETMPGGVSKENIRFAKSVVADKFSFGMDVNVIDDPVTTKIDRKNIAQIVKASEAMGEMVRRSRDLMTNSGEPMSGNDIMNAIARDMADGFLDGMGADGSNPTVAAVANLVTGQVLVEAMTNSLRVNGVDATVVMDQAIATTHPEVINLSDSVRITADLLTQAELAIAAAQTVDGNSELLELERVIQDVVAGSSATEVASIVSTSASQLLDNAIKVVSTADPDMVVAVNLVANNTPVPIEEPVDDPIIPEPVAENNPPVISGSPSKTVIASNTYSFKPNASDADGDALSFNITNKPDWASFNSGSGELSGVPFNVDAGTYSNIVISVSDGSDTVKLPAFSIQVNQQLATTGNMNLSWTAPSTRADGTPLSLADIDGFRVYYGESEGEYNESVNVDDGSAQSVSISDVPVGSYHVVMTTLDSDGRESSYSSSVVKTVQ